MEQLKTGAISSLETEIRNRRRFSESIESRHASCVRAIRARDSVTLRPMTRMLGLGQTGRRAQACLRPRYHVQATPSEPDLPTHPRWERDKTVRVYAKRHVGVARPGDQSDNRGGPPRPWAPSRGPGARPRRPRRSRRPSGACRPPCSRPLRGLWAARRGPDEGNPRPGRPGARGGAARALPGRLPQSAAGRPSKRRM